MSAPPSIPTVIECRWEVGPRVYQTFRQGQSGDDQWSSKSVCIGEEKLHYAALFGNTVFCDHAVDSIFHEALLSNDSNQFK